MESIEQEHNVRLMSVIFENRILKIYLPGQDCGYLQYSYKI